MILPPLPSFRWLTLSKGDLAILVLMGLCCTIEILLSAADTGLWGSPRWRALWLDNGAFWAGLLRDWQPNYTAQPWLMFATYAFLHVGPMHLVGNMLTLLWLGPSLQSRLGVKGFCLLWLTAASGGAVCFAVLSTSAAPMVGASGAVFGLLGAIVALDYLDRGDLGSAIRMTGLLITMNAVMFLIEDGGLAWETHLGGYLAGVLAIAAINPPRQ